MAGLEHRERKGVCHSYNGGWGFKEEYSHYFKYSHFKKKERTYTCKKKMLKTQGHIHIYQKMQSG